MKLLEDNAGRVCVKQLPNGSRELSAEARDSSVVPPHSPCITNYSDELIELIFRSYGSIYTCDEISRDLDKTEATIDVRYSVDAYFSDDVFSRPLNILDYGCGAGSSALILSRLFPHARITAVDFLEPLLQIARLRAAHYGLDNVKFEVVPPSGEFLSPVGRFEMAFLNAVYEHLLPGERPSVVRNVWAAIQPGGALIINQTPHRWFPIETHTSGLPLVNYMPDPVAHWVIGRFSRRGIRRSSWNQLLRAGVRGASVGEIMRLIKSIDASAVRLPTVRLSSSWAGIWYAAKRARLEKVQSLIQKMAIAGAQQFVGLTRLPLTPYVNIAVSKGKCTIE